MLDQSKYRPNLPANKQYLSDVAKTIQEKNEFETIHFEYLSEALQALGFSQDPFAAVSLENFNPVFLKELILAAQQKANSSMLSTDQETALYRLWDYLAVADPLEKSDLIFLFGGPSIERAHEAIQLWKDGWAPTMLFTGQKSSFMKDVDITEAEYYAQVATKEGVPDSAYILETQAKNTPENAVKSFKLLKDMDALPNSVILITLPYHMRRAYYTFKAAADWKPKIIRHTTLAPGFTREKYWEDEKQWEYVLAEYIKMYGARLMKHF